MARRASDASTLSVAESAPFESPLHHVAQQLQEAQTLMQTELDELESSRRVQPSLPATRMMMTPPPITTTTSTTTVAMADLQHALKDKDLRILQLEEQLATAKQKLVDARQQFAAHSMAMARSAASQDGVALQSSSELAERCKELEAKLGAATSELGAYRAMEVSRTAEAEQIQGDHTVARFEAATLREQVQKLEARVFQLQDTAQTAQFAAQEHAEELQQERATAHGRFLHYTTQLEQLAEKLNHRQKELAELKERIAAERERTYRAEEEAEALRDQMARGRESERAAVAALLEARQQAAEATEQLEEVRTDLAMQLHRANAEIEALRESYHINHESVEESVSQVVRDLEQLRERYAFKCEEHANLMIELEEARAAGVRWEQMERAMQDAHRQLEHLHRCIDETKDEHMAKTEALMQRLSREQEAHTRREKELKKEVEALKAEVEGGKRALLIDDELVQTQARVADLTAELVQTKELNVLLQAKVKLLEENEATGGKHSKLMELADENDRLLAKLRETTAVEMQQLRRENQELRRIIRKGGHGGGGDNPFYYPTGRSSSSSSGKGKARALQDPLEAQPPHFAAATSQRAPPPPSGRDTGRNTAKEHREQYSSYSRQRAASASPQPESCDPRSPIPVKHPKAAPPPLSQVPQVFPSHPLLVSPVPSEPSPLLLSAELSSASPGNSFRPPYSATGGGKAELAVAARKAQGHPRPHPSDARFIWSGPLVDLIDGNKAAVLRCGATGEKANGGGGGWIRQCAAVRPRCEPDVHTMLVSANDTYSIGLLNPEDPTDAALPVVGCTPQELSTPERVTLWVQPQSIRVFVNRRMVSEMSLTVPSTAVAAVWLTAQGDTARILPADLSVCC